LKTKVINKEFLIWYLFINVILILILLSGTLKSFSYDYQGPWLWIIPLIILLSCIITAITLISYDWRYIPSPITFFILTIGLFHGFGPLIYRFGDSYTLFWMNNRIPVDSSDIFRGNLLILVGLLFTVLGIFFSKQTKLNDIISNTINKTSYINKNIVLTTLLLVGIPFKYILALPYSMGLLQFPIPGSLFGITNTIPIAIMLLSYMNACGEIKYRKLYYGLLIIDIVSGILCMSKTWIILPILAGVIGKTFATQKQSTIIKGFLLILTLFIIIQPFILSSRGELNSMEDIGFDNTISVIKNAVMGESSNSNNEDELANWWIRLSYIPAETFAMNLYDNGIQGNTIIGPMKWVFIPRILYPDKPIFNLGNTFSKLIDGNEGNNDSPGIYGEFYWNFGWPGVIIFSLYVGWLFGFLHKITINSIERNNWAFLSIIYMATLILGKGVTEFFLDTYFIQLIYITAQSIVFLFILLFINNKVNYNI
jgi:hypothetical protein